MYMGNRALSIESCCIRGSQWIVLSFSITLCISIGYVTAAMREETIELT